VWDVPRTGNALTVDGSAGVRITCISRTGGLLDDREFVPGRDGTTVQIPAQTERIVAQCLGATDVARSGFGAISASAAPPGADAVTGWQAASMLMQAAGALFLARGAVLRSPRPVTPVRSGSRTNQTVIRASEVMRDETATETSLPVETEVVMILLDRLDTTAASHGDLAIACDGATLTTPPLRVDGGERRALLYQVTQVVDGAATITVSTASAVGWRVSGVVGLPGSAQEWAVRANGGVPEHLVPEGPLTPDGQVRIRLSLDAGKQA